MAKRYLLAASLFLLLVLQVSAHPGRTDANGGHADSADGSYHYHHGFSAHQHTGGVCPYDYEDQTSYSSAPKEETFFDNGKGSHTHPNGVCPYAPTYFDNGKGSHTHPNGVCPYANEELPEEPEAEAIPPAAEKKKSDIIWMVLGGLWVYIIFGWAILYGITYAVFWFIDLIPGAHILRLPEAAIMTFALLWPLPFLCSLFLDYEGEAILNYSFLGLDIIAIIVFLVIGNESCKREKKKETQEHLAAEEAERVRLAEEAREQERQQLQFREERKRYVDLYGREAIEVLVPFPIGVEIGEDGLPKLKGAQKWGKAYTFYVSKTGKTFHKADCNPAAKTAVHALHLAPSIAPCKNCKPVLPDFAWYRRYQEITSIKKTYNIDWN